MRERACGWDHGCELTLYESTPEQKGPLCAFAGYGAVQRECRWDRAPGRSSDSARAHQPWTVARKNWVSPPVREKKIVSSTQVKRAPENSFYLRSSNVKVVDHVVGTVFG